MLLGKTLRQAREAKGQTVSQVAEATRMMVQIVEDLEREDFRRIAAPIYGRGFIKLYAEYLDLDPEPLIQEFIEIYTGSRPPQIERRMEAASDSRPVGPSDKGAGAPAERPAVPLSAGSVGEADLFTLAAGRSEAVIAVADPAQTEESAPPRARATATRSTLKQPATGEGALRREPVKSRENGDANATTPSGREELSGGLPVQRKTVLLTAVAGAMILLLLLLVIAARHHKTRPGSIVKSTPIKVERVLPPAAPFFE